MTFGDIQLDVVKNAGSWGDAVRTYNIQKLAHTPVDKPPFVTRYMKSREEAMVNPITQKFNDDSTEKRLKSMEQGSITQSLNNAWDKQLSREQHFDIITQRPKRGHIHEVPYVQRLKPPSLITANHENYNVISTLSLADHHWAPPEKRPPRVKTPPRKEPMLTAVNRPREFDIVNNRFRNHHEARSKWEMDQARSHIVDRYWETHDFDPVTCTYYDKEKEVYYQRRIQEMLLTQGTNAINKLPPTLAASESLMYDICTGVVKDPHRLQQKIEADRATLEARASKIGAEEMMRVKGEVEQQRDIERKMARIAHTRYRDVTDRGFNILSNDSFDQAGHPPPPQTKPRLSLWAFRQQLRGDGPGQGSGTLGGGSSRNLSATAPMPGSSGALAVQSSPQSSSGIRAGGGTAEEGGRMPALPQRVRQNSTGGGGGGAESKSLSRATIRSGGFQQRQPQRE